MRYNNEFIDVGKIHFSVDLVRGWDSGSEFVDLPDCATTEQSLNIRLRGCILKVCHCEPKKSQSSRDEALTA